MKDNFKANNKCKRCHRELKDDNTQYGWRCAEIMGLSSNNKSNTGGNFVLPKTGLEKTIYSAFKYDEIQQRIAALKKGNPNIQTYRVGDDLFWVDPSTFEGIGFLPDGTLVHGKDISTVEIELALSVFIKEKNPELVYYDFRIDQLAAYIAGKIYFRSGSARQAYIEKIKDYNYYQIYTIDDVLGQDIEKLINRYAQEPKFPDFEALVKFKEIVNNGGPADLKNQEPYKKHSALSFNGEIISRDVSGNIAYGALGKYFKIPDMLLYGGAGFAQLAAGTSDARWLFSFFDDPRDQERVKQGIKYYHERPQLWLEED